MSLATILKDSAASIKAWKVRYRAVMHKPGQFGISGTQTIRDSVSGRERVMAVGVNAPVFADEGKAKAYAQHLNHSNSMAPIDNHLAAFHKLILAKKLEAILKTSEGAKKAWLTRSKAKAGIGNLGHSSGLFHPTSKPATTGEVSEPDFAKALKKIKRLTNDNFHTEALSVAAKLVGAKNIHKTLLSIEAQHNKAGYLPDHLAHKRLEMAYELKKYAKKVLTLDQMNRMVAVI